MCVGFPRDLTFQQPIRVLDLSTKKKDCFGFIVETGSFWLCLLHVTDSA